MFLEAIVACSECGTEFLAVWMADADSAQDLNEAPEDRYTCPECETEFTATYPGWINYTEAG